MKQMSKEYMGGQGRPLLKGEALKGASLREVSGRTAFQAEGTAAAMSLRQKWAQRGDR